MTPAPAKFHPLYKNRIAEFVSVVSVFFQFCIHVFKHVISDERTQEFVVAAPRLVRSGDDRVDNSQRRFPADSLSCQSLACSQHTVDLCSVFESAYYCCANSDNASAMLPSLLD